MVTHNLLVEKVVNLFADIADTVNSFVPFITVQAAVLAMY